MISVARTVFDCNVLLQSLISSRGPAHSLLDAVKHGKLTHFTSQYIVDELRDVASRPRVQAKYRLSAVVVEKFCDDILAHSTFIAIVPQVFELPRDPADAHYVDLAVATNAKLIVSRDKDLLSLRDPTSADGLAFRSRFPHLSILTPPEALQLLSAPQNLP